MLFCNKRSFVWLKKIVFYERFFAIVDSVFFLYVVASLLAGLEGSSAATDSNFFEWD